MKKRIHVHKGSLSRSIQKLGDGCRKTIQAKQEASQPLGKSINHAKTTNAPVLCVSGVRKGFRFLQIRSSHQVFPCTLANNDIADNNNAVFNAQNAIRAQTQAAVRDSSDGQFHAAAGIPPRASEQPHTVWSAANWFAQLPAACQ
jgi:hypothetical protein